MLRLFIALWLAATPALSYAGSMTLLGAGKAPAGGGGFVGPGDLSFSTPLPYYAVRAYSSATRGNNLINICDPADVTCADWKSDAVTGALVATTNPLNGTDCTVSTTCTIKTWYDISGTNLCDNLGPVPCDVTQAVAASRATLLFNCTPSGKACGVFVRASTQSYTSSFALTAAKNQPITSTFVGIRTGTITSIQGVASLQNGSGNLQIGFDTSPVAYIYGGTAVIDSGTATDNAWHSVQGLYSGASSLVAVDGVDGSTANTGTQSWTLGLHLGYDGFTGNFDGKLSEFGIFGSAINRTTMCHNQFSYYGTATSC